MKPEERIIAIRNRSIDDANAAFADFMHKTEDCFNQRSKQDPNLYKNVKPTELEKITEGVLKEIAPSTPFDPNEIKLISGHKFPDIVAEKYYGVEVKSTKENKWTSTGSSIVESTRIDDVDNIFMFFGKLGGNPPEFRCRPYQDCLYDIAVTHSPRYLIDMSLRHGETIFDKIGCQYDTLRNSPDAIDKVKQYYKKQAKKHGNQMPWWMNDAETEPIGVNMRLWNDANSSEHAELRAQMLVLFPEMVNSKYGNAAMWLAGAKGIIDPSFRDRYSAGGKVIIVDGKPDDKLPRVWKTLSDSFKNVNKYLVDATPIMPYIVEYNPDLLNAENIYEAWMNQIERFLPTQKINGTTYNIREVLESGKRLKIVDREKKKIS